MPVHPRVCGEQLRTSSSHSANNGSSPRVRGTDRDPAGDRGHRRFIPACAGNSTQFCESVSPDSVHPRVCGEQVDCLY